MHPERQKHFESAVAHELHRRRGENELLRAKVQKIISENEEIKRLENLIKGAYVGQEQRAQMQGKVELRNAEVVG